MPELPRDHERPILDGNGFNDLSKLVQVHLIVKEGQCWDVNGPSLGVCVPSHSLSAWYTPSFSFFFFSACACLDCPFNTFLNSACAWLKWSFSFKPPYILAPCQLLDYFITIFYDTWANQTIIWATSCFHLMEISAWKYQHENIHHALISCPLISTSVLKWACLNIFLVRFCKRL